MPPLRGDAFKQKMAEGRARKRAERTAAPLINPPESVTFICNSIPALGLGLPSGIVSFDHGILELTDPRDIAAIRKHYWFGSRILERGGANSGRGVLGPEEGPADPAAAAPEAVPVSSPPAASSPHSPFRRFLRQAEGGGYRCALCDMASPYFPTEGAALNHLFHQHRSVTSAPEAEPAH